MESNKDEGQRCLKLARKNAQDGNLHQALKLAEKSLRLYPTTETSEFVEKLREILAVNGTARSVSGGVQSAGLDEYEEDEESDEEDEPEYTDQQAAAVRKIVNCKDYYEVLGVSKDASDIDLKKAYRRLALQFHPDKNKAPGAADAFKAIGTAFSVLSDADKRRRYDQFGHEDPQLGASAAGPSPAFGDIFSRYGADDLNPEEIFSMFFRDNGFSRQSGDSHRSRAAQFFYSKEENQSTMSEALRLAPLAVVLVLSILSSIISRWNASHQIYSFRKTNLYSVEQFTNMTYYRVQYFVTPTFEQDLASWADLKSFEEHVEAQHISDLESSCAAQKRKQKRDLATAQFHGDVYYQHEVRRRILSSCDALRNLPVNNLADVPGGA